MQETIISNLIFITMFRKFLMNCKKKKMYILSVVTKYSCFVVFKCFNELVSDSFTNLL